MLRARSSRLTLLSSTTSSRAPPRFPSRTLQLHQCSRDARIFDLQRVERRAAGGAYRVQSSQLEVLGHRGQRERAEGITVRLERVRSAAKALSVVGRERAAKVFHHDWRFDDKGIDEILHEVGARGRLEVFEDRTIDNIGHLSGSLAPVRA